jgi:hypothetical protein
VSTQGRPGGREGGKEGCSERGRAGGREGGREGEGGGGAGMLAREDVRNAQRVAQTQFIHTHAYIYT